MTAPPTSRPIPPPAILVVMGVAGAGKSTLAAKLASALDWEWAEGDAWHSPDNVRKMAAGDALTDVDREPWLREVGAWIDGQLAAGRPGIVTCSALRRAHRDILRRPSVTFVHLEGAPDLLADRLAARDGHFMPPSLLPSQLAVLERPGADERAVSVDVSLPPAAQVDLLLRTLTPGHGPTKGSAMQLGMIGLGRMGANMAQRLRGGGHQVVGYDRLATSPRDVEGLNALLAALDAPRVAWVMLPAGEPTNETIAWLAEHLDAGDTVVEGGNSPWGDAREHADLLARRGIDFVDAGVSGGVHGLANGYGLMVGGEADVVARLAPIFDSLAPTGGFVHAGAAGAGHFSKMVHNGIEYALMQAYGEGYELLRASDLVTDPDAVVTAWQHGTVVRSWLLELLAQALADDPALTEVPDHARDSGEGRWTVQAAVELGVPVPTISAALFARFSSQLPTSPTMQVVAALRDRFGAHGVGPRVDPAQPSIPSPS